MAALGATARSTISSISVSERGVLFVSLTCVPRVEGFAHGVAHHDEAKDGHGQGRARVEQDHRVGAQGRLGGRDVSAPGNDRGRQADAHEGQGGLRHDEGASATVAYTMIGAIEFGMMWLSRMRAREAPVARAAVTNSSFLADRTEPRVMRAMEVQPNMDRTMTTIMMEREPLNICMNTIAARSSGIAKNTVGDAREEGVEPAAEVAGECADGAAD